jgi:alpha-tubulin suppressor-like RCC1 family protein
MLFYTEFSSFFYGYFTEQITSVSSLVMTSVACGEAHSMALNQCGQLYTWGSGACCQLGKI